MATDKAENAAKIFRVINFERIAKGFSKQKNLSEALGKQSPNLWKSLRNGSTKFDLVVEIAEALDLQIIVRNKETNTEHIITDLKNQ